MKIANYTTEVDADKSVAEIQRMLGMSGARAIMIEYELNEPSAISFRIERPNRQISFRLPCDWKRTLKVIHAETVPNRFKTPHQAKRVAWRIVRDWLRAQLSLIEIDAADPEQVFLPYAVTPSGQTLYERFKAEGFQQLALPESTTSVILPV